MITVLIGFFSGIISGMGVGGGMILIPALTMLSGVSQHTAQSINLFYFIPTALASLIVHIKNKNIEYSALSIIITGVVFSALGAFISSKLSADILRILFGIFIFVFGVIEILGSFKKNKSI